MEKMSKIESSGLKTIIEIINVDIYLRESKIKSMQHRIEKEQEALNVLQEQKEKVEKELCKRKKKK